MDASLLKVLKLANEQRLCVDMSCTTCGGMLFATTVMRLLKKRGYETTPVSLGRISNQLRAVWLQDTTQRAVLTELKALNPNAIEEREIEPAARYLIYSAYSTLGLERVESALPSECFAGQVLVAMKAHYANVQLENARWIEVRATERRARAQRLADKQVRHAERLEKKKKRDAERLRVS